MDKFVTTGRMPTPHERELLTILIEEAAEVQQRATKMLRFGVDEVQPGQPYTNAERLGMEVGDLDLMIDRCLIAKLIGTVAIEIGRRRKAEQLAKFIQTSPGAVDDPSRELVVWGFYEGERAVFTQGSKGEHELAEPVTAEQVVQLAKAAGLSAEKTP